MSERAVAIMTSKHRPPSPERIDLDQKGALDEVVLHDIATAHLERCTRGMWFLALTRSDHSQLAIWISATPSYEFRDGFAVAPKASPRQLAQQPRDEPK